MVVFLSIVLHHLRLKFLPWWHTSGADDRCNSTTASCDPVIFLITCFNFIFFFFKGKRPWFCVFYAVTGFFLLLCGVEDSDGTEEPCSGSPALPTPFSCCSGAAPCPRLGAEAALRSVKEGQGGLSASLSSCPWGCRSEKGNPALLGRWREGMDHSLSFNMGMASWLLHNVG